MSARLLYFDCSSGASGDMILGALVDAGCPPEAITTTLRRLPLRGWDVRFENATRGAVGATSAVVKVDSEQPPRRLTAILEMIGHAGLEPDVEQRAVAAFTLLGEAEAAVHRTPAEEVHLHEAGAADAIIDVVGSMAALSQLRPDRIVSSAITTGMGHVDTAHGVLPLPAPAVVEIARQRGAPLVARGDRELLTPTGAAIVCALADEFGPIPHMRVDSTGYGAGAMDLEVPNVLRVLVGTAQDAPPLNRRVIETNVDDMSAEIVPYVIERLIQAGAEDAWVTPILMKKGRPAHLLSVLVEEAHAERVLDTLFSETTTFGARIAGVDKVELPREWIEVDVAGVAVRVKVARRGGEASTLSPEYEDCVKAARETGMPLKEVFARAEAAARLRITRWV